MKTFFTSLGVSVLFPLFFIIVLASCAAPVHAVTVAPHAAMAGLSQAITPSARDSHFAALAGCHREVPGGFDERKPSRAFVSCYMAVFEVYEQIAERQRARSADPIADNVARVVRDSQLAHSATVVARRECMQWARANGKPMASGVRCYNNRAANLDFGGERGDTDR